MAYTKELPDYGDLITVEEYRDWVRSGMIIDYDGEGAPVKDGMMDDDICLYPSRIEDLPPDATHVMWFNR